jgi:hypothetical protein
MARAVGVDGPHYCGGSPASSGRITLMAVSDKNPVQTNEAEVSVSIFSWKFPIEAGIILAFLAVVL